MDEEEAPTLVRCPACKGHGRRHVSGSMRLDQWGAWEWAPCPLCGGKGMCSAPEAAFWSRAHDDLHVKNQ